jgi:hypothetical protein
MSSNNFVRPVAPVFADTFSSTEPYFEFDLSLSDYALMSPLVKKLGVQTFEEYLLTSVSESPAFRRQGIRSPEEIALQTILFSKASIVHPDGTVVPVSPDLMKSLLSGY